MHCKFPAYFLYTKENLAARAASQPRVAIDREEEIFESPNPGVITNERL